MGTWGTCESRADESCRVTLVFSIYSIDKWMVDEIRVRGGVHILQLEVCVVCIGRNYAPLEGYRFPGPHLRQG